MKISLLKKLVCGYNEGLFMKFIFGKKREKNWDKNIKVNILNGQVEESEIYHKITKRSKQFK